MNSSPSATSQESATSFGAAKSFTVGRTIVAALLILVAALIGNVAPSIPFTLAHIGNRAALLHPPVNVIIAVQVGMDAAVILAVMLVLPWAAKSTLGGLGFHAPSARTIGLAIASAVAMIVVVNGLGTLIDTALKTHHEQLPVEIFRGIRDPQVRVQFAFYAVMLGPVAEEMAFRIFLFNAFMRSGDFWIPAIASSVLFGAVHTDLYAFFPLVLGGLILCAVYYKTGNAWAPMITHGLFNLGSLIAIYIAPQLAK